MNNLLSKQGLINIILILYTLSIVLDLHIFYNRISTLIRVGIISILFLIVFLKFATKKDRRNILIYFLLLGIYLIFHFLNLNNNNLGNEFLYFLKMTMHILIFFIVYKLDINMDSLKKIINPCLILICGSIVICNLFKLGYSSYGYEPLKGNFISWFGNNNLQYYEVSGKGYFHSANQVIAIILLYVPIILIKLKEKFNFYNLFTLIISLLSLLILGNRISSWGPIIVLAGTIILYLFISFWQSNKINVKYIICLLLILVGYGLIFSKSPLLKRNDYYDSLKLEASENEVQEEFGQLETILSGKVININFPKYYYPYSEDPDFWNELISLPDEMLVDSRFIEIKIVQRVIELNNNYFKDHLLGIGYDRIINIQNIEKDYIMQYYSIGLIGTILLLGVYFLVLGYIAYKIFINLETKFNYSNLMLLMGICIVLVSAYFSGNLLNSISIILPLSFVLGVALNEVIKKGSGNNVVLGFKICDLTKGQIIDKLNKEIMDGNQNIIFNINPLIVTNFYKNFKMIEEFNSQKYNIPDGIGTVFAAKMKDGTIKERIAGIDLVEDLVCMASKSKYTVYLYGSKDKVADKAKKQLEKRYKNIKIVGTMSGYVDEKVALKDIVQKKPDILFVALGSPKQELFIVNNKKKLKDIKVIMPVGGSLDVISKTVKRAPEIYSKYHIEWLYRMIKEPKRIKQNMNLFKFVFLVIFRNNWYNKKRNGVTND